VTFERAVDAREAMEGLDGSELEGCRLRVNEAKSRDDNGGGSGARIDERVEPKLFVTNLSERTNQMSLETAFMKVEFYSVVGCVIV
jgi:RNA recognition motif-containing protein